MLSSCSKYIQCNHLCSSSQQYQSDSITNIDKKLTKFWEIEELPQRTNLSSSERLCEEHFISNTTRLESGRFCVRLPLLDSPNTLGDSYDFAKKRFLNLEKRFRKNTELKTQYTDFINEYAELVACHKDDQNLQLILWREDESQPINTYKLNTVTYGTASASYLSTRCLWQVGEECGDELIKSIIQNDFYVDDLITGSNDEDELRHIKDAVSRALNLACFPLRKYKSNLTSILRDFSDVQKDKLITSESSNTLGLGWSPSSDQLHFPIKPLTVYEKLTKRIIMSNSLKIFDPLGLLSPCIIIPKMMLQKLWLLRLGWDEPVSQDIQESWDEFVNKLPHLGNLQIPRHVLCENAKVIEIHSFSDASQSAYGACIYIKSVNENNDISVKLLCSKSKVTPLKPMTIPCLELCAALLAARLTKAVCDAIKYKPSRVVHWCDSSVVLAWIHSEPRSLKTFVASNR
ncbi:hypothetical protein HF086_004221 [Spodoptera exigua]|uniref:Uncharacterized protein n=1 Tax=Spodoptera exigua TaxID=7107 RepID=A0A922MUZ2_SPOEX|nr:hypothetical protein HF086_004221 [Spodoptera exigua]